MHSPGIENLPITDNSDQDLAEDDTDNLEIVDRVDPLFVANRMIIPAGLERGLKQGFDVSDGEQNVTKRDNVSTTRFRPVTRPIRTPRDPDQHQEEPYFGNSTRWAREDLPLSSARSN